MLSLFSILVSISLLFAACGGQESYKSPLVMQNSIVQSECVEVGTAGLPPQEVTVNVRDRSVTVTHTNIYLPRGSLLGIADRNGYLSWRDPAAYYYLDAGYEFLTLRESAHLVASDVFCLYDLTVTIQNFSGGEYTLYLFDHTGAAIDGATTDITIR
jgi:hypothetical protein